jgi:hypothetical protein
MLSWPAGHSPSIAIHFAPVSDAADNDLFQLWIRQIKHAIVAYTDAKPVPVLQLFSTRWKGIGFECENRFGNSKLHLRMQPGEFLPRIAGDVNLPTHALMPSSFKT